MIENKSDWKNMNREERGKLLCETRNVKKTPRGWRVQSQTNHSIDYTIQYRKDEPKCTCPDCEIAKKKCKHIYAVEFYIKKQIDEEGKITTTKGIKVTYGQKWSAYDKSQTNEKLTFMKLLNDLCSYAEQPTYEFGRPKLPVQDLLFSSVMKVYTTFSLRRFMSDIKIAKDYELIDYVPCFSSVGHFMQREDITPILKNLIKLSSLPLKEIETDVTIDSSGFSTSRFGRWFDHKYGKDVIYRIWIKAHVLSGVKTNIILNCEVTEGRGADCPQLAPLLKGVEKRFDIKEVSCDRAYSSKENLEFIGDMGAIPYIPFKSNVAGKTGNHIWKKMYHYYLYKHDEFLEHYHKRSNAETVFHMIKTKFKDNLRSKTTTAMVNELLLKVLCHNICVIIQETNELGITSEFIIEKNTD